MMGMTADPTAPTPRRIPADTFPNRLLLARRLAGMSIEEASAATGINKSSWANWEAGRRPHRLVEVCEEISEALDIDFNWLLLGGRLAEPKGAPVTKKVRKSPIRQADEDSLTTPRLAGRAAGHGPKGRSDHTRPASPVGVTGRRPARVGAARAAQEDQDRAPMVINLG
jgi:transcriptional regulator with XRE-family HTH domain